MVSDTRVWQSRHIPRYHPHRQHTPVLRGTLSTAPGGTDDGRPARPAPRQRPQPHKAHAPSAPATPRPLRPALRHTHTYRQVHAHILQVLTLRQVDVIGSGQDPLSAPPGARRHHTRPQNAVTDSGEETKGEGKGGGGVGGESKKKVHQPHESASSPLLEHRRSQPSHPARQAKPKDRCETENMTWTASSKRAQTRHPPSPPSPQQQAPPTAAVGKKQKKHNHQRTDR